MGYVAEHPELNQIMVIEGTTATDRSTWMTQTYVKPFFDGIALPARRRRVVALRQCTRGSPAYRPGPKRSHVD
jgi:hypothetical protein